MKEITSHLSLRLGRNVWETLAGYDVINGCTDTDGRRPDMEAHTKMATAATSKRVFIACTIA